MGSQVLVSTSILDIMKIHSVVLDLFHAYRHNVASTGTSQEYKCTYKHHYPLTSRHQYTQCMKLNIIQINGTSKPKTHIHLYVFIEIPHNQFKYHQHNIYCHMQKQSKSPVKQKQSYSTVNMSNLSPFAITLMEQWTDSSHSRE